ncbi:hypothetical protein EGR52_04580 [bacterium]|nr:hypothetical protein [bacterium]MBD8922684.1 hypothetical protein [bacterium]
MKKKVILALILVVIFNFVNNKEKELNVLETKELNNNTLSMMLETSAGTGEYQEATASSWPTEGYTFNENLSKCENGSSLSWDNTKKKVVMEGNSSDKCYVYFDVVPPKLADYVKSLYTIQGANNLYLHDSSLENGANDGSYRYAGSSETTNNFVCFGYDSMDGTCPTDNLYRIIGVFDNQVKLIKYDYANSNLLGTDGDYSTATYSKSSSNTYKGELTTINSYYWNYKSNTSLNGGLGSGIWSSSLLNKTNLNTNYLNNIGKKWNELISMHTWKVYGGSVSFEDTVAIAYKNEITLPAKNWTYDAKVGLIYISDYGYAALPSAWTTQLKYYNNQIVTNANWMYMGLIEWTILQASYSDTNNYYVYYISSDGSIPPSYFPNSNYAIRPVFYLNSDISYAGGLGTKSSPFIIN